MMVKRSLINIFIFIILISCKEKPKSDQNFDLAIDKFKKQGLNRIDITQKKLPYLTKTNLDPIWNEQDSNILFIPAFSFQNQNNELITEKSLEGKITVICFFYTRCSGFCPRIMQNMNLIKKNFESEDIYFLSYSVTPDIDTPNILKQYGERTGYTKSKWNLLTGDKDKIYKLARETFNADTNTFEKKSSNDFIHSEQIYIIDSKRRLRGIYNGNVNGDIERVIVDLKNLMSLG